MTCLLLIASTISGQDLRTDSTLNSIFTTQEINNLEKVLNFFTTQICKLEEVDSHQEIDCFEQYCKNLKKRARDLSSIDLKLSLEEQRKFYTRIDPSSFHEVWHYEKLWKPKTTDTVIIINVDPDGRYARFLNSLGQEHEKVGQYYQDLESLGGICPTMIAELLMNYKAFDFTDERIRLLFAIHYLTMNDQFSAIEEN